MKPVSSKPPPPAGHPPARHRASLDLRGAEHQAATVDRLLALGAQPLDIGQRDVPWVVLSDVEGNPFCVMERRAVYVETGPIAAQEIVREMLARGSRSQTKQLSLLAQRAGLLQ